MRIEYLFESRGVPMEQAIEPKKFSEIGSDKIN